VDFHELLILAISTIKLLRWGKRQRNLLHGQRFPVSTVVSGAVAGIVVDGLLSIVLCIIGVAALDVVIAIGSGRIFVVDVSLIEVRYAISSLSDVMASSCRAKRCSIDEKATPSR
jgi:hypothetical protein